MRVEETISISSVTLDRVWDALVDMESRPRWSKRVKEAQVLGGGPLQEDSRIRLRVGRDRFTAVVTELRPRKCLALEVRGPGFKASHEYHLAGATGATTLTIPGQFGGLLGGLLGWLGRGGVRRDLREELAAIQRAAEQTPKP